MAMRSLKISSSILAGHHRSGSGRDPGYPGGAREWNWKETGTSHSPGIQLADVEELLEHGACEVILTRGMLGNLKVPAETISALEARGVTVHVAHTPTAIRLYNQLREKVAVGALIHSTC